MQIYWNKRKHLHLIRAEFSSYKICLLDLLHQHGHGFMVLKYQSSLFLFLSLAHTSVTHRQYPLLLNCFSCRTLLICSSPMVRC